MMLRSGCGKALLAVAVVFCVLFSSQGLWAIPSPLDHKHVSYTVHWQQAGSPALPWTNAIANQWMHNHLTADPISNNPKWDINKAWDNRNLRSAFNNPADAVWAHGMILAGNEVRYGWGAGVPIDAKNVVQASYNDWVADATTQFNAKKDPWDILAIAFTRADNGPKEITIQWVNNLLGTDQAYGDFSSVTKTIRFEANPYITLSTPGGLKRVRLGDAGVSGTSINVPTPWEFSGIPTAAPTDFDFSVDGGTTWTDAPPGGFGNLTWNFGVLAPADNIDIYDMDFETIAKHEIGHSIALGHTGNGSATIMRDDIAKEASFGSTMGIDANSALAVAIDYTYAVPEPATLTLTAAGFAGLGWWRRRRAA